MGEEEPDPLEALSGTGLRVYLYLLLENRPLGVRELQRRMGFSSPSTARHHLERLASMGLVEKTREGYRAKPPRRGLLRIFIVTRGRLVPVSLASTVFTAVATLVYALLPGRDPAAVAALAAATLLQVAALRSSLEAARELEELVRKKTGRTP